MVNNTPMHSKKLSIPIVSEDYKPDRRTIGFGNTST